MARVILAPFIESISGKVGNLQFRTLKSGRTVVHARRCVAEDGTAHRSTPPTPAEIAHRKRFGMVSSITAEISDKLVIKGSIKKPMPLNRLGMVLKKAGYMQKCLGGKVRGWLVRERETAEINANRNINAKL